MKASPGYPIPHKSLAVGWGFREAWQNCCIKQEQTSHTSLTVSYVKASDRTCLHGTPSVHICKPCFLRQRRSNTLSSPCHFVEALAHTCGFPSVFPTPNITLCRCVCRGFQVYAIGAKQGILCSKMLTHLCSLQSSLWSDSERMRAATCQKAVNYTCGGQIWARHRGRCGWRCHVFRR